MPGSGQAHDHGGSPDRALLHVFVGLVYGGKDIIRRHAGDVNVGTGRVERIDPAVENGTVTVDVERLSGLPKGARPDLSVDGIVELERLENVLYVGRPAQGQGESEVGLFRFEKGSDVAVRTRVSLGRASVSTIEVLGGLDEGDEVILSDTTAWDSFDRIRVN